MIFDRPSTKTLSGKWFCTDKLIATHGMHFSAMPYKNKDEKGEHVTCLPRRKTLVANNSSNCLLGFSDRKERKQKIKELRANVGLVQRSCTKRTIKIADDTLCT